MSEFQNKVKASRKFAKLPGWAQFIALYPDLSRWGVALAPFLICFIPGLFWYPLIFIGAILSLLYVVFAIQIVPVEDGDKDPNVAILSVLDVRIPRPFRSGLVLTFLGISKLILFKSVLINRDFEFDGVRCRLEPIATSGTDLFENISAAFARTTVPEPQSGGEVDFSVSLTSEPNVDDPWGLIELDTAGEIEGAVSILKDAAGEDIRQIGRHLTWLQASFASDIISCKLVSDVTDQTNHPDGTPILENMTEQRVREYLDEARRNGFSSTKGLGLIIRRLNVTKIKPVGELAKAAETAVVEKLRRAGLLENAVALTDAVEQLKLKLKDGSLKERDLINILLVNDKEARVKKDIKEINIPGGEQIGTSIGNAIGTALRR